jgi:DNA-binding CsgD family transcriptional regulator
MCSRLDRAALERALELHGAEPAALAIIRATVALYDGDSASADGILSRALTNANDEVSAGYIVDTFVPLLIGRLDIVRALAMLEREPPLELRGTHAALLAIVAAQKGDVEAAHSAYAIAEDALADVDDDLIRAKIVGRGAVAAFYLKELETAIERSQYAAERSLRGGSPRMAANNYVLLVNIYRGQFGDADMARYYAVRQTVMANRANDMSAIVLGLSMQLEIAAAAGELKSLNSLRRRVLAIPSGSRYRERLSIALGELLEHAWAGDFVAVSMRSAALREGDRTDVERSFCESLLALAAYARGFRDEAASWVSSVLARGFDATPAEVHFSRISRIIVAHVEIGSGRLSTGRRLLVVSSLRNIPEEALVSNVLSRSLDESTMPKLLIGYCRALVAADRAARTAAPLSVLTPAEALLLPIMAQGQPVKVVAAQLGKRESTIRAQVREIARKLGTHSLVESIAEARRQGLL